MRIARVESSKQLKEIWNVDCQVFGNDYEFSFEDLYYWWQSDPDSYVVAYDENGKYVGGITFWSIPPNLYQSIISESVSDADIYKRSDFLLQPKKGNPYFYLGGLLFMTNRFLLKSFLSQAIFTRFEHLDYDTPLHICSAAFTPEGSGMLGKLPFKKMNGDVSGFPVYAMTASLKEMLEIFGTDMEKLEELH